MSQQTLRTFITVVMNVLVVVAILLTVRVVVRYFGVMGSTGWGEAAVVASDPLLVNAGIEDVRSPYSGVFDANATISILVILAIEWLLSVVRDRL